MKNRLLLGGTVISLVLLTGCEVIHHHEEQPTKKQPATTQKHHHFNYQEQHDWHFQSGHMQSPINIDTDSLIPTDPQNENNIQLHVDPDITKVIDNGHSIEIQTKGDAMINGRHLFHIHTPGEHTIDEKRDPMEIHFVTKATDGRIAVIAVMAKTGHYNPALQSILLDLKHHQSKPLQNIESLFPKHPNQYYHYLGSLTTPPLTENVEWYIWTNPIQLSNKQLHQFEAYYKGNNRHLQKTNNRRRKLNNSKATIKRRL